MRVTVNISAGEMSGTGQKDADLLSARSALKL
jgi:hypothetical protein